MQTRFILKSKKYGFFTSRDNTTYNYTTRDFSKSDDCAYWFDSIPDAEVVKRYLMRLDDDISIIPIEITIYTVDK